jgi:hypothetical protein
LVEVTTDALAAFCLSAGAAEAADDIISEAARAKMSFKPWVMGEVLSVAEAAVPTGSCMQAVATTR